MTVGLRAILRGPRCDLIGEMRDLNTIETALTAAETGHLVFAALHTNSAPDSIDRMVGVFPAARQQQISAVIHDAEGCVVSTISRPQKRSGQIAACEVMVVTPAIKNLIREGKTRRR